MSSNSTTRKPGKRGKREVELPLTFTPTTFAQSDQRFYHVRERKVRIAALRKDATTTPPNLEQLLARTAHLELVVETQEVAFHTGQPYDAGVYVQNLNALNRLYRELGLKQQDDEPTNLDDYLENR